MISRTTRSRRSSTLSTSLRPSGETSFDFSLCSRIRRNSSSLCANSVAGIGFIRSTPCKRKFGLVQNPDRRLEQKIKCAQRPNQSQRNRQWIRDRGVLRRQLAEHDVHERNSDERERDRNRRDKYVRVNVRQCKKWFEQVREKFFTEPSQRQTRHCHAELCRRKISVEM